MAKKSQSKDQQPKFSMQGLDNMPKEAKEKLEKIKGKLETFQKKIVDKFDKYIIGVSLMPPPQKDGKPVQTDKIKVIVLVDDSDSKKMTKQELKDKLSGIIAKMAKDVDKNMEVETIILSEVWGSCYDAKYDVLQQIAMSAPVYDTGMMAAIKISEIHKTMVLKKFEKYIVSYVLSGSLIRGQATPTSDIDVFVVIDDTDVKKMTRAELKDKLRSIIIGMGIEAGELTGIKNKLNIQVYILTDFWDSLKEANPIIFTLLRDGVPFYDRGIFMPWKQLLLMGKIKPSAEAIDMFMHSGEQMIQRVHHKLREIGMEDTYYAILTPSQAALMLFGATPPTPKETANLMRDIFVKKEKLLEDKFVDILERNINIRKELEHGSKKDLSGKDVDNLVNDAEKYLKRVKRLFSQIEKIKEEESVLSIYDTAMTVARDVLKTEGHEKITDSAMEKMFKEAVIDSGIASEKYMRILKDIIKAKKDYEDKKLTKNEIDDVRKKSRDFVKTLVEHMQRKRGRAIERAKIRVQHGEKMGEVTFLGKSAFVVKDIAAEKKDLYKGKVKADGSVDDVRSSSQEEYDEEMGKADVPDKVFVKEKTYESLKKIFGKDIEILVSY